MTADSLGLLKIGPYTNEQRIFIGERLIKKFRATASIESHLKPQATFQHVVQHIALKQLEKLLLRVQEHQFSIIKNWTFREAFYSVFS